MLLLTIIYSGKKSAIRAIIIFLICGIIIYLSFTSPLIDEAAETAGNLAKASLLMTMPDSGSKVLSDKLSELDARREASQVLASLPASDDYEVGPKEEAVSSESQSGAEQAASSEATSSATTEPPEGYGTVTERFYSSSSANLKWENVYVSRKIDVSIDIAEEIATKPDITILKNGKPQVLIMHTHTTESYLAEDNGTFKIGASSRSTDENLNMIAVGNEIADKLNAAGIVTLHDKTMHDYPSYNGAYERSEVTVKSYLEQYPSIEVVLDIHRDAISTSDTKKIKPTATINGKKAAQVMIINGCEYGNITDYPNWRENLRFGLRVQQAFETMYPGLARPLMFDDRKYNQQLTNGSILIEMGSDSNTLEEAKYSGQLVGDALVSVLERLRPQ